MLIKVALASASQCDRRTLLCRCRCAAALAASLLCPSGPGHQAHHWHSSRMLMGEKGVLTATHEKQITDSLLAWQEVKGRERNRLRESKGRRKEKEVG